MACVLCFYDRVTQRSQPFFHDLGNAIAHRTGPTVKLRCNCGEEAAAAKDAALDVGEPDVTELPESQQTLCGFESWLDDFANKDCACGFDGGGLELFLRGDRKGK